MRTEEPLAYWSPALGAALTSAVIRTRHRFSSFGTFTDHALADLLDRHPRDHLQAYAPGLAGASGWPAVDLGAAGGAQLLAAVASGSLWLNAVRVDEHDPTLRGLQRQLLLGIGEVVPDLIPGSESSTILISSESATVPYHLDPEPNVLWQIRGRKRLLLYPAANDAFVSRTDREDLFAGLLREFVPYEPTFDDAALAVELGPGDVLAWPQNAPHRIENLEGLNVTLSTVFQTQRSRRRRRLYCANRFLRRRLHLPANSTTEQGTVANLKLAAYAAGRCSHLVEPGKPPSIVAELRLETDTGRVSPLAAPMPAAFT